MPRLWLVERSYDDRNLISFVYATTDGTKQLRKELSATLLQQRSDPITAAIDIDDEDELAAVDPDNQEQYATEAQSVAADYEPDEPI
ncbi:hypothetical protein EGH24_03140 [Halonotius terrestris]|uniref:DUF7967 domain-containing protein n=1 Tax=Halonotius terrestris TaxID=2487750 RepID=A0A8J8PES6_9EURY|nr:hypothetical protein [Halonotius terrestris]TQQ83791.1 hypothetical protein EGH24_03140 [Halonotius terrestris]